MNFSYINPYYNKEKDKVELRILFDFYRSFEIEYKEKIFYSREIIVHNLTCSVTFLSSNNSNPKKYVFQRDHGYNTLNGAGNVLFSHDFADQELEELLEWRSGGVVTIKWHLSGNGLVELNNNIIPVNLITYYDSNYPFSIIKEVQWTDIVNCARLDKKYIAIFPLTYPDSIKGKTNPFLSQISTDLNTMITKLNDAVKRLRKSSNSSDYKSVLIEIKGALESIKEYEINPSTSGKFLMETKTFKDIDIDGGLTASNEVMGRIKGIMEHVYKISSKSIHVELERKGKKFSMEPDKEDALLMLEISLSIYRYFIEKSKKVN